MKICDECETVAHCTEHGFIPKQQALDKMAENARELGLDYEPARLPFGIGGGLVAIKTLLSRDPCTHAHTAIQMIDAILAERPAQQEPVAILNHAHGVYAFRSVKLKGLPDGEYPLYTSPPAPRKPLTLGQKQRLWSSVGDKPTLKDRVNAYGLAIEAAHGIKENT